MGASLSSTLSTHTISKDSIRELCNDKVIYKSPSTPQYLVLYFGDEIKEKCYEIFDKNPHATVHENESVILAIEDQVAHQTYACPNLSPNSWGFTLDK